MLTTIFSSQCRKEAATPTQLNTEKATTLEEYYTSPGLAQQRPSAEKRQQAPEDPYSLLITFNAQLEQIRQGFFFSCDKMFQNSKIKIKTKLNLFGYFVLVSEK
jgi:hypothetical protein